MTRRLPLAPDASAAKSTASPLPPLYAGWVSELLEAPLPEEPHAPCDRCVMVGDAGAGPDSASTSGEVRFDDETKCCTYQPVLASFLVGRILRTDEDPRGASVVRARIRARERVTPLGIEPPSAMRDRYAQASRDGAFGRTPALVCPHFRPGSDFNCAIWLHRNATCSTWFCKHERGATSATFWKRLRDMLALIEARLSRWCALELGLPDHALARLITTSNAEGERTLADDGEPSVRYASVWADWLDREEAYFVACAEKVEALAWPDVEQICGADAALDARLVRHGLSRLDAPASFPAVIRLSDVAIGPPDDDGFVVVRGYSEYDPLVLPQAVIDALRSVEGTSVEEGLAALRQRGVVLDRALLAALVDFEILKV